jgi:hypothetical protein
VNNAPTLILDAKARRMIDEMIAAEARHLAQGGLHLQGGNVPKPNVR